MGELNFFLGLQIKKVLNGSIICQQKYIKELLESFHLEEAKLINTPIRASSKFHFDEPGSSMNETMYRGIIVLFLYLTTSRPDIVFSVGMCERSQACPKEPHLKAAKRILIYLKGTTNLILFYTVGYSFDLFGYIDVDYTGYFIDRKSNSGMTHFLFYL